MLTSENRTKLKSYVDNIIKDLKKEIVSAAKNGISGKALIDKTVNSTVKKLTPESKSILSAMYNMMKTNTFNDEWFSDSDHKSQFYSINILKELSEKISFDIPDNIDYEESNAKVKGLIGAGVVISVGGVISISMKSPVPICIAAVLAAIMAVVIKKSDTSVSDISDVINEYFDTVKKSVMLWIDAVEKYYDERVNELKMNGV